MKCNIFLSLALKTCGVQFMVLFLICLVYDKDSGMFCCR